MGELVDCTACSKAYQVLAGREGSGRGPPFFLLTAFDTKYV